jgi:uncharacterized damage-inducible protein DinB
VLQPIDHYDILLKSRRMLLDWVRERTPEEYTREFPFGLTTIRATVVHLADAEWLYGMRVRGEEFDFASRPFTVERFPTFAAIETAWKALEPSTREWLKDQPNWQRRIEITSRIRGRPMRVVYTPEKVALQMCYHEVHHRAQIMAMLRQMGVAAQNLDFSLHAYEWTPLEA